MRYTREVIAALPSLKPAQLVALAMLVRRYQDLNIRAAINADRPSPRVVDLGVFRSSVPDVFEFQGEEE